MTSRKLSLILGIATLSTASAIAQAAPEALPPPIDVAAASAAPYDTAQRTGDSATMQQPVRGTLRGVLAAAEQGPDALRRYVFITRSIYNYRFQDFAKSEWYQR
jgi:hypothetical protein